jgi:NAD(P)-dependent dehydrogenase (short-subunit alcohol dehydrogenase family)
MFPEMRHAVVTGAGSGIGRAISLKLANAGWHVALVGRRKRSLSETASLVSEHGVRPEIFSCDVANPIAVDEMATSVVSCFGSVQALVNAAGINIPHRRLAILSVPDFHNVIETNLFGAYYCTRAFILGMLARKDGTIVNISSEAGRQASVKSGSAYTMSKFGLAGLTQSINAEERENGIRACCIFLGDVATPLLDHRPHPPSEEIRLKMLQPDDVAECVRLVLSLPQRAIVEEMVLRPRITVSG